MPTYRYYTADVLSGAPATDLDLFGVYMTRQLSQAGDFNGSFRVGTGVYRDQDLIDGSLPGKFSLYCERDGVIIWGGIIWSRTYQSESKTIQITAQTFESFFSQAVVEFDINEVNQGQYDIFKRFIANVQAQPYLGIGLDGSGIATTPGTPTGELRTITSAGIEAHFADEVISTLMQSKNSFDWTIDVVPSVTQDRPSKIVRVGYPLLGSTTPASFDYPGNISNYWWPENASQAGVKFYGVGAGSGSTMLTAVTQDSVAVAAGFPGWGNVSSDKDLDSTDEVAKMVEAAKVRYGMPIVTPTFQLNSDRAPMFEIWSDLGSAFSVYIEDARFPLGKLFNTRMIGWQLNPASVDGPEVVKLQVDGGDV